MSHANANNQEQDLLARLRSADPSEARQAAFEAGDLRMQSAIEILVDLFANSSVGVQEAAERSLRKIRGAGTVQSMVPLLRLEDTVVRNIAMDILREVGSDDMDTLVHLLYDDDPDIRIFISDILGSTNSSRALAPLCDVLLHDPEVNVRYQAAVSLGELGNPEAAECLRKAIHDEEWVQYSVMEALAKIKDAKSVDILIEALNTSSPLVASTILDALGDINSVRAAPLLLNYLDQTSGPLRTKALKALIQILGPNSLTLLEAKQLARLQSYMLAALKDDDEDTLKVVLSGLASTGVNPAATKAVLELASRTDPYKNPDLLQKEFECLVGIGYNEALEEALHDPNEIVRRLVIDAFGQIPGRAGKYALKRHFDSLKVEERQHAMEILSANGDDRDIPFFSNHLTSTEDPEVLRAALLFLGVNQRHVESAPELLKFLEHPSDIVKEAALEACLALADEETIKAIVAYKDSPAPEMRRMAAYTMGFVNAEYFATELAHALQDESAEVRKTALEAIGGNWPESEEKLEALAWAARDANREVRLLAVGYLGDSGDEQVLPLLGTALDDEDDWVKVRAIEALGHMGVKDAVPRLIQMLEDNSVLVQLKLIEALGLLGGDLAFRALMMYISHSNPDLQAVAADAISHIRREEESEHYE